MNQNLEQINQDIPPHVQRMINEYTELTDKIKKLTVFINLKNTIYMSLDEIDKNLLASQLVHMTNYSNVLTQRIERALGGK